MARPAPDSKPRTAGVIAPPPLIYAIPLALALAADYAFGAPGFGLPIAAATLFRAADTEVAPWRPSTALVTGGIYRLTRNPMYVGMALIYAGISLLADSPLALACLLPVLAIMTYGVIQREEHYLGLTFGEEYRAYKGKTRRWL